MNGKVFFPTSSNRPTSLSSKESSLYPSILLIGGGEVGSIGGVVKFFADFSAYLRNQSIKVTIFGNSKQVAPVKWFYKYNKSVKRVASNYRSLKRDPRPLLDVIEQSKADIIVLKFSNRPVEIIQNILDEYRIEIPIIRAEHGNVEDLVDTIWKKNWRSREATFSTASRIHLLGKNFLESARFPLELFCKTFTCPSPVYERAVLERAENDRFRFIFWLQIRVNFGRP